MALVDQASVGLRAPEESRALRQLLMMELLPEPRLVQPDLARPAPLAALQANVESPVRPPRLHSLLSPGSARSSLKPGSGLRPKLST